MTTTTYPADRTALLIVDPVTWGVEIQCGKKY